MPRITLLGTAAAVLIAAGGHAHSQGFTPQELDRMSKERLDNGALRNFAAPPSPPTAFKPIPLHQPKGIWICMSATPYIPILAEPRAGAAVIGQTVGEIAAGEVRNGYTSTLIHEGMVGYVPTADVHPYHNEFNPAATCTVAGLRANGVVQFKLS
jgi:hypothetical protein